MGVVGKLSSDSIFKCLSLLASLLLLPTCTVLSFYISWANLKLLQIVKLFQIVKTSGELFIQQNREPRIVMVSRVRLEKMLEAVQVPNIHGAGCSLYS